MKRFVGIKNNHISLVSDKPFIPNPELKIIEVPESLDEFSSSDLISNFKFKNNLLVSKMVSKPAKELKIAFVSNFKMQCGISSYGEFLFPEIIKHIKDFRLFIEENNNPTSDLYTINNVSYKDKIIPCWKRGESLKTLVSSIKEYNPDIILINHEYGLFPNARYWLSMMNQLSEFRVIAILHSVFHHQDKTIIEAAIPEIITHLQGGHDVLKFEKQISSTVHIIPHGCYPVSSGKLWNFYKSKHTLIQLGFGFKYKHFEDSIKATAILAKKYPDVFFTALFSESPFAKMDHQKYYDELMNLVLELNIQENVAIIRGFQSDTVVDSYLRTNQVVVFPYQSSKQDEVFGASGAARLAFSKNLPVITSNGNHFSDLPSIKADSPEDIANEIDKLFSDPTLAASQVEKQKIFIEEHSWANIALKFIKIFENARFDKI